MSDVKTKQNVLKQNGNRDLPLCCVSHFYFEMTMDSEHIDSFVRCRNSRGSPDEQKYQAVLNLSKKTKKNKKKNKNETNKKPTNKSYEFKQLCLTLFKNHVLLNMCVYNR